ncbi:PREDICTED: uncharacterized protein LOC106100007 [Papilio polytes]|uniref:uncharacterized protein LOC106100007 n=1 Tax=Papilio polytes TaxID=76194 RepID=UPI0006766FA0|nr:PREDICTED: uncharacterized protein LOC106100007 [Papilio polytes]
MFERVLGLKWNPQADYLSFNLGLERLPENIVEGKEPSKSDILRVMSLFDALGFAAPITVRAKQFLQETWRRGVNCDDHLENSLAEQWREWMTHLRAFENIKIARFYRLYSDAVSIQLHTFVDASETSYALYWRITTEDGSVHTSLVLAKARVVPLKLTSVPRLELQAAVMGCRMAAAVIEEYDQRVNERIYWTDSRTVLAWIHNGARSYRLYVAHRIADIEENSKVDELRWVPTKFWALMIREHIISEFLNIEMCLLEWIKRTLDINIPINGPLLKEKSKEFATKLGIQNFSAGNGWRHDIAFKKKQLGKVNL